MITIGIRAAPKEVTFVVYDSDADEVKVIDKIIVPKAFDTPDALKYVRSHFLDVLREYSVEKAVIKVTEANSQQMNASRIEIEGVIQEAFASSGLTAYSKSYAVTLMSRLGRPATDYKPLREGRLNPGVENWAGMTQEGREAFLSAKGAIHA